MHTHQSKLEPNRSIVKYHYKQFWGKNHNWLCHMLHFLTALSSEWNTITVHREANYPLSVKPSITDLLTAGNKSQTPLQIALKYVPPLEKAGEHGSDAHRTLQLATIAFFRIALLAAQLWIFLVSDRFRLAGFKSQMRKRALAFVTCLQWIHETVLGQPGDFCPHAFLSGFTELLQVSTEFLRFLKQVF